MMEITDKGREVIEALRAHKKRVVEAYFGDLPEEDVRHLTRIFKQILSREEIL